MLIKNDMSERNNGTHYITSHVCYFAHPTFFPSNIYISARLANIKPSFLGNLDGPFMDCLPHLSQSVHSKAKVEIIK